MVESSDGLDEDITTEVQVRKCTDQDLDKFFEPTRSHSSKINKIIQEKTAYCIKSIEGALEIFGESEFQPHRRLNISLEPARGTDQTLKNIKKELGSPGIELIMNRQRVMLEEPKNKDVIKNESFFFQQYFDPTTPSSLNIQLHKNQFEDETDPMRFGWAVEEFNFFEVGLGSLESSPYRDFPNNYKFIDMSVFMSSDMKTIGREGPTLLSWLGDVGGLSEALFAIGFFLTGTFGRARMIALLTNRLFKNDTDIKDKADLRAQQ
jgi:hypothetical protein